MIIRTQELLADMFAVAPKTINQWTSDGMPVAKHGGPHVASEYVAADVINWKVERELRKIRAESAKDRLHRLQADKIEMENAEKRGHLIPAAQLEPKLRAAMISAREFWRNEPARLARDSQGKTANEIEDLLSASFDAFLVKLSRWPSGSVAVDEAEDPTSDDE